MMNRVASILGRLSMLVKTERKEKATIILHDLHLELEGVTNVS